MSFFQNLTRGEVHAGFSVLGRLGADEDDWREMTNNEDLARLVVSVLQQYKTPKNESSKPRSILRRIEGSTGLALPATDGQGLLDDKDLFTGYVDLNLANWGLNVRSKAKPQTLVDVYELTEIAKFHQIFSGQGVDLDQLCLTQDQIKLFAVKHYTHLHPKGYATFFLTKVSGQYFVPCIHRSYDLQSLGVNIDRYDDIDVNIGSGGSPRFVLPQLAVKS